MAETGFTIAGTGASVNHDGATYVWSNPSRITTSDTSYAQSSGTKNYRNTYLLRATNFGFSIPSGATILGVTARYRWYADDNNVFFPRILKLWSGSADLGTDKGYNSSGGGPALPTSIGVQDYGNSTDLWGASLTPAIVNTSGFGIDMSIHYTNNAFAAVAVYVDAVWLNVAYSVGSVVKVKDGGVWKDGAPSVKDGGIWKPSSWSVKDGGIWKQV